MSLLWQAFVLQCILFQTVRLKTDFLHVGTTPLTNLPLTNVPWQGFGMSRPCWVNSRVVGTGGRTPLTLQRSTVFQPWRFIFKACTGWDLTFVGQRSNPRWWENSASNTCASQKIERWTEGPRDPAFGHFFRLFLDEKRRKMHKDAPVIFGVFDFRFLVLRLFKNCNSM